MWCYPDLSNHLFGIPPLERDLLDGSKAHPCLSQFLMRALANIVVCVLLGVAVSHPAFGGDDMAIEDAFPLAKERVYHLNDVGGFAGFAIQPTPFLTMSVVLSKAGDKQLFESYLQNSNPVVRAMGLACLAQTDTGELAKACERFKTNSESLTVWRGACMGSRMSLGELADKLRGDRNYLGYLDDYWDFQRFRRKVGIGRVDWKMVRSWPVKDSASK